MKLLCFGDSNTYGCDPRSYLGGRYPVSVRWTGLLARATGWEIHEAGQNGREIPSRPGELQETEALLTEADGMTVMLGSNDLLQHPAFTAQDAAARMERFLLEVLSCSALTARQILLIAPPPMIPGTWVTEPRLLEESAALADCYQALTGQMGVCYADAGQWGVSLLFDGVHFTEAGHRAFAAGVQSALLNSGIALEGKQGQPTA